MATTKVSTRLGGTNTAAPSITALNNITGLTASGTTGTTSTNLVFSTSPTLTTPTLNAAAFTGIISTDMALANTKTLKPGAVTDGDYFALGSYNASSSTYRDLMRFQNGSSQSFLKISTFGDSNALIEIDGAYLGANIPCPIGAFISISGSDITLDNLVTISAVTEQITLGTTHTTTISSIAPAASRIATIPALSANDSFAFLAQTQSFTNKTLGNTNTVTLKDTLFTLQDDGDATKQARFQLSGITTGNIRTYTVPNYDGTFATLTGTETLSAKTLVSPAFSGSVPTDIVFASGFAIKSNTTSGNTFELQGYNTSGTPAYETFLTLTSGTAPNLTLATPSFGSTITLTGRFGTNDLSIFYASIWSSDIASSSLTSCYLDTGGELVINNLGHLISGSNANDSFSLSSLDLDASSIVNFITLTSNNTPSCAINAPVGSTGSLNGFVIGATLPLAGTFTTLGATSVTTANTSFNLLNTTATTLNFAGAATTLNIGASTGNTLFNHDVKIAATKTLAVGTVTGKITTITRDHIQVKNGLTSDGDPYLQIYNSDKVSGGGIAYTLQNCASTGNDDANSLTLSDSSFRYRMRFPDAGGMNTTLSVIASIADSGTPNVLVRAASRQVTTNQGATGENYNTLPSAVAGLEFTFYCENSNGIRITAAAGDTIEIPGQVSVTAGYAKSIVTGSSGTWVAINNTKWVPKGGLGGTWTIDS